MKPMLMVLLILVYTLTCLFVILTVLLQSGKGGGLSSLGSGAGGALSDSLGATGAEKTLIKATSWGSGIFLALSLVLTLYGSHMAKTAGLSIPASGAATQQTTPATTPAGTETPAEAPTGTEAPAQAPVGTEAPAQAPAAPSQQTAPIQVNIEQPAEAPATAPASTLPAASPAVEQMQGEPQPAESPEAPANRQ